MSLIRGASRVALASSIHGRVQRRQRQRWATEQQWAHPGDAGMATASGNAGAAGDPEARIAQLKSLAELRAAGVLTESEFDAEKRKVLQA